MPGTTDYVVIDVFVPRQVMPMASLLALQILWLFVHILTYCQADRLAACLPMLAINPSSGCWQWFQDSGQTASCSLASIY